MSATTDTYITITKGLLHAAVDQLEYLTEPADVSLALLDAFIADIEASDPFCDHSVGICCCETIGVLDALKLARQGRTFCSECGGDGWAGTPCDCPDKGLPYDCGTHWNKCETCDGTGSVPFAGQ